MSEGEFHIGSFVLLTFIESVTFVHFIFALHKKKYLIGWIFRYTYKHLEHLRNTYIIVKYVPLNRLGAHSAHNNC